MSSTTTFVCNCHYIGYEKRLRSIYPNNVISQMSTNTPPNTMEIFPLQKRYGYNVRCCLTFAYRSCSSFWCAWHGLPILWRTPTIPCCRMTLYFCIGTVFFTLWDKDTNGRFSGDCLCIFSFSHAFRRPYNSNLFCIMILLNESIDTNPCTWTQTNTNASST